MSGGAPAARLALSRLRAAGTLLKEARLMAQADTDSRRRAVQELLLRNVVDLARMEATLAVAVARLEEAEEDRRLATRRRARELVGK